MLIIKIIRSSETPIKTSLFPHLFKKLQDGQFNTLHMKFAFSKAAGRQLFYIKNTDHESAFFSISVISI
ncbi:hypothetical protein BSSX_1542 [Bacillus subtilis]|nr:hypothetical protein BSSX_1542 [Bacillus subtilis]